MRAGSLQRKGVYIERKEKERRTEREIRQVINYAIYTRHELIPLYRAITLNREEFKPSAAGTVDIARRMLQTNRGPFLNSKSAIKNEITVLPLHTEDSFFFNEKF